MTPLVEASTTRVSFGIGASLAQTSGSLAAFPGGTRTLVAGGLPSKTTCPLRVPHPSALTAAAEDAAGDAALLAAVPGVVVAPPAGLACVEFAVVTDAPGSGTTTASSVLGALPLLHPAAESRSV